MRQTFVRQMLAAALPVPSDRTMTFFGICAAPAALPCKGNYHSTTRTLSPLPADHHFDSADFFSAAYPNRRCGSNSSAGASACGKPPIATRVNAVPDLRRGQEAGEGRGAQAGSVGGTTEGWVRFRLSRVVKPLLAALGRMSQQETHSKFFLEDSDRRISDSYRPTA
jgi:hypothetical protein